MRYILAVAMTIVCTSAVADWQVKETKDAMTDEVRKSAYVTNEEGNTFSVYRISEKGAVWGNFSLSATGMNQISPQKPPIYRIDKHAPNDLASSKAISDMKGGIKAYEWQPKWVNFLMWHGKENEGMSPILANLMEGEKVVVRYYLFTGGYKDTTFTLKGAPAAISRAIGISEKVDHAKMDQEQAFKTEYIAQSKKCRENMGTFRSCFDKVSACGKQANNNVDELRKCVGQ